MNRENTAHQTEPQSTPEAKPTHDLSGVLVEKMHKKKEKIGKTERKRLEREKKAKEKAAKEAARKAQSEASKGVARAKEEIRVIPTTTRDKKEGDLFSDFSSEIPVTTHHEIKEDEEGVLDIGDAYRRPATKREMREAYSKLPPTEEEQRHIDEGTASYEEETPFKKEKFKSTTPVDEISSPDWQVEEGSTLKQKDTLEEPFKEGVISKGISSIKGKYDSSAEAKMKKRIDSTLEHKGEKMMKESETAEEPKPGLFARIGNRWNKWRGKKMLNKTK
ncbi:MAG: hypothetical protein HOA57_01525 [Candidatus Magasanikbacteria bacterium]|jgi:hypothetical protein|nr:hypothetical protein [Candidatus Magasanikbacteria bacterium]MBT4315181.1 hypothetical protein [Candidatus Magasanikbacteria bacterium]MBT4547362.1 hypothetical protein [Candidatus Magasanikbacteria bacterium]MBT6819036.1 hypothetical protein [Candidatus Magasanikbacteria bacterium]